MMVFSCCSAESSDSYQHLQITAVTFFLHHIQNNNENKRGCLKINKEAASFYESKKLINYFTLSASTFSFGSLRVQKNQS